VPLDPDEVVAACRYQAKDIEPERHKGKHYLPSATAGLQFHWSSSGWWQGISQNDLWRECIAEWFPDRESSNNRDTLLEPNQDDESPLVAAVRAANSGGGGGSKSVSLLLDGSPAAVAERAAVVEEIDRRLEALPRRNAVNILHQLPDHQGVKVAEIAEATGLPVDHVRHQLKNRLKDRGAVAPPIPLPGGGWQFDSWFRE
jgi:DNA-binding transcriptional ArsR family regulator